MSSELTSHLFNLGFLSIATASLVFVFLAESSRLDPANISRAIVLRLGPLAIVFLLGSTTFALIGAESHSAAVWAVMVTLGLLMFAVACLFSLGLYFLRFTLALVHLDTLATLLDRWPLWLALLAVPVGTLIGAWAKWGGLTTTSVALTGFCAGYFVALLTQRKYLCYGFSQYEEALSATEWYEKLITFVSEAEELYITAITPGFVLPSEFDPISYPVVGQAKSPVRKALFETYFSSASAGLQIKYLFDQPAALKVMQSYRSFGVYERYRKVSQQLLARVMSTGNIEIRYRELEPGSGFRRASVVSDRGVMFSERGTSQKIRHGELVRNKSLSVGTVSRFMQKEHWADATPLTPQTLDSLWDSALVTP